MDPMMDCTEFRLWRGPFLDDEVEMERMLRMIGHLENCPSCAADTEAERMAAARLREIGTAEECPAGARSRILASLAGAGAPSAALPESGRFLRPALRFAPWAAAAAAIVVTVLTLRHQPVEPATPASCAEPHGSAVTTAVALHEELAKSMAFEGGAAGAETLLAALRDGAAPGQPCRALQCPDETIALVRQVLDDPEAALPRLAGRVRILGMRTLEVCGQLVPQVLCDAGGARVSLFVMKGTCCRLRNLGASPSEIAGHRGTRECPRCRVVAWQDDRHVFIMVGCSGTHEANRILAGAD